MVDKGALLAELYQARFDGLKEIAIAYQLPKSGSVESLRARLIQNLILDQWDLSEDGIKQLMNAEMGGILGVFGIKKSGSIRARRQRLFLHLYHDPKILLAEKLDERTRDQLHAMCKALELPLSGNKQALLVRIAGVLASQQGGWGKVKKSLRRPRGEIQLPNIPYPNEDSSQQLQTESGTVLQDTVDDFVSEHPQGWTFEEETEMRTELAEDGLNPSLATVSADIDIALRGETISEQVSVPPMIQSAQIIESESKHSLETEAALIEINSRKAEIKSAGRDFLMISSTSDSDDLEVFISSLANHGFAVEVAAVRDSIRNIIMELDFRSQTEKSALHSTPNSWSEREALRTFESARNSLRGQLADTLAAHPGDLVKARMAFEEVGRSLGLDMRIPSISGRLHALFDLHVDIGESQALQDPAIARRNRVLRILQHGTVHLQASECRTLDRIERNIVAFEELVETVLESSEGTFSEAQQALVIRFLESRGYEVNTATIRPRILACAGIIGSELGFISPSEIPRIAPGIIISDTQVDAIVVELQALADAFKPKKEVVAKKPEQELAESVANAADHLTDVRAKIDRVDNILERLRS
ncbi:MAG: hypothetical protein P8Q55_06680 [Candidatus Poseidoniaceae archaeon]|nr:hypothetical protein [Candidatus Poseidoniaceae archaeon]